MGESRGGPQCQGRQPATHRPLGRFSFGSTSNICVRVTAHIGRNSCSVPNTDRIQWRRKRLLRRKNSSNYPAGCDEQEEGERGGAIILQLKNDQDGEWAI